MTRLKYVKIVRRRGTEYHYVRYKDEDLISLSSEPYSPDYYREYASALDAVRGSLRPKLTLDPDRLDRRVDTYLKSAEVTQNHRSVITAKKKNLLALIKGHEHEHPRNLTWDYIKRVRDEKFSTIPTRNEFTKYVSAFLNEMMSLSVIPFNPVPPGRKSRIKHTPVPRDVWRAEQFEIFRNHWPIGTSERLAFELFYNTAQRCETVRHLGPGNVQDGKLVLDIVAKDGEPVAPKIRPMTAAAIAACPAKGPYFLPGIDPDKVRSSAPFSHWFSSACRAAGLPAGFTAHGIRHGVMTMLAERGFSAEKIQALTGHKSTQMVAHYTKSASRGKMTSEAVDGLDDEILPELENSRVEVENTGRKNPPAHNEGDFVAAY